jgi:hypothetical protein
LIKPPTSGGPKRERAQRYETAGMTCPIGEVVDMSETGLKIRSDRRPEVQPGQKMMLRVHTHFQQLVMTGCVRWVRRGSGGWHTGVEFVDLKPGMNGMKEMIGAFAEFGFVDTGSMGPTRGVRNAKAAESQAQRPQITAEVEVEDLYAVMGLKPDTTPEELHETYRKLAKKYHPDVNGSLEASEKFAEVNKAYSVLHDVDKRKRYDEMVRNCGGFRRAG